MSGEGETLERLPVSEWNFDNIPADEIHHCFFYEYARSCPAVIEYVKRIRREKPRYTGTIETTGKIDKEAIELRKHQHWRLLLFLVVSMPRFPDLSWQKALDAEIEKWTKRDSISREFAKALILLSFQTYGIAFLNPLTIDLEQLKPKSEDTFENPLHDPYYSPNETLSFLLVNWGNTDSWLVSEFHDFLKASRPKDFPEPKRSFRQQAIHGEDLPFFKKSALDWLGVWRRKQSGISWTEFIKIYSVPGDRLNSQRRLGEQFSKANVIFEWLEKGGNIISLKEGRKLRLLPLREN